MPDSYSRESSPLYIIVTDADDPAGMLGGSVSSVRYFERLPEGESFFRIDLSKTGLQPGDVDAAAAEQGAKYRERGEALHQKRPPQLSAAPPAVGPPEGSRSSSTSPTFMGRCSRLGMESRR